MSRWWRAYDDAVNNPKLQRLPATLFKAWFNLCCITSKHDGELPPIKDVAFSLRISEQKASEIIEALLEHKMLDRDGEAIKPHDWQHYQYQSDSSAERMRRHRKKKRDGESDVSVTVQSRDRTEAETEQKQILARKKRATQFPEGFLLTDERRAVAIRHGIPDARVAGVFEHFRDHHKAKGTTFLDWDAAWRTWCKNDQKFNGGANGNNPSRGNGPRIADGRTGADALLAGFSKVADRLDGRSDDAGREDDEVPRGRVNIDV